MESRKLGTTCLNSKIINPINLEDVKSGSVGEIKMVWINKDGKTSTDINLYWQKT